MVLLKPSSLIMVQVLNWQHIKRTRARRSFTQSEQRRLGFLLYFEPRCSNDRPGEGISPQFLSWIPVYCSRRRWQNRCTVSPSSTSHTTTSPGLFFLKSNIVCAIKCPCGQSVCFIQIASVTKLRHCGRFAHLWELLFVVLLLNSFNIAIKGQIFSKPRLVFQELIMFLWWECKIAVLKTVALKVAVIYDGYKNVCCLGVLGLTVWWWIQQVFRYKY